MQRQKRKCPRRRNEDCACVSSSVVSESLQAQGPQPTRLLCPWSSPGKNTAVDCHFFLQGIFPTQTHISCFFCNGRQILFFFFSFAIILGRFFYHCATWETRNQEYLSLEGLTVLETVQEAMRPFLRTTFSYERQTGENKFYIGLKLSKLLIQYVKFQMYQNKGTHLAVTKRSFLLCSEYKLKQLFTPIYNDSRSHFYTTNDKVKSLFHLIRKNKQISMNTCTYVQRSKRSTEKLN